MKWIFSFLVLLLFASSVSAVTVNGINYNLYAPTTQNRTATVISGSYSGNITIPTYITYNNNQYRVNTIGSGAFKDCKSLISVSIPGIVTIIGDAFQNSSVTSVVVGNSLASFNPAAFKGCALLTTFSLPETNPNFCIEDGVMFSKDKTKLVWYMKHLKTGTSYVIPDYVTYIGTYAFNECSNLVSITTHDGIVGIGTGAFRECSALETFIIPDEVIRDKINEGYTLPNYIFENCFSLTTVTIGKNVETISNTTFKGCNKLSKIIWRSSKFNLPWSSASPLNESDNDFPNRIDTIVFEADTVPAYICQTWKKLKMARFADGVKVIGQCALSECDSLDTVELSNTLSVLRKRAFWSCKSLKSISIPYSVDTIGSGCFLSCKKLEHVQLADGIKYIDGGAFARSDSLKSLVIPNTVKYFGDLYDCPSLSSITVGEDLDTMVCVFAQCTSLSSIVWNAKRGVCKCEEHAFPNQLTSIIFGDKVERIPSRICRLQSNIPSIVLPNSVTEIGAYAFSGCSTSIPINIPANVRIIEDYAFAETSFKNLELGSTLETIGNGAFCGCGALKKVQFGLNVSCIGMNAFAGTAIDTISLPNGISRIENFTFRNCAALQSITIPENVHYIGGSAFEYCVLLDTINIPNIVDTIGSGAFDGCVSLKTIVLSEKLDTIGAYAFRDCSSLKSLNIPQKVKVLEDGTFKNCTKLESITFQEGLLKTKWETFRGCISLDSIVLPNSLNEIGYSSFANCQALNTIEIPKSVSKINHRAFEGCTNLERVIVKAFTPPSIRLYSGTWSAFYNCNNLLGIYVPCGSLEAYQKSWNEYANIIKYEPTLNQLYLTTNNTDAGEIIITKEATICNNSATIKAVPNESYEFDHWSDGVTENPRAIIVDADIELTAYFRSLVGTDIEDAYTNDITPHKVLQDGHIYILRGDKTYTLQGQEVK